VLRAAACRSISQIIYSSGIALPFLALLFASKMCSDFFVGPAVRRSLLGHQPTVPSLATLTVEGLPARSAVASQAPFSFGFIEVIA
jgi:hypothetical protein